MYHNAYFYFSLICHFCENGYRLSAQRRLGDFFFLGGGGGAMDD